MNNNYNLRKNKFETALLLLILCITILPAVSSMRNTLAKTNSNQIDDSFAINKDIESVTFTEKSLWDDDYGLVVDIFVQGSFAYLAMATDGLLILDISNLQNPTVTGTWNGNPSVNDIYVQGNYLYFINSTGLNILDITDKSDPQLIGNYTAPVSNNQLFVSGNFAYITYTLGFYILNVTEPTEIVATDSYLETGLTTLITIGNYTFVKDTNRVIIFNVTDPTNIGLHTTMARSNIRDFCVAGNYAYLTYNGGLDIWNITTITSIGLLTNFVYQVNGTNNILVDRNYAFIQDGVNIIALIDVNNKTDVKIASYRYQTEISFAIFITKNNILFIINSIYLELIDATTILGMEQLVVKIIYGSSLGIFIDNKYAYIADSSSLEILDISDLDNLQKVGSIRCYESALRFIYVRNNFAYGILDDWGLMIYDISNKADIIELGNYTFVADTMDLFVTNDYAFIANDVNGLLIIDIYYPNYPQFAMNYNEVGSVQSVQIKDNLAYLVADNEYLFIVDFSNPFNPEILSNWTRGVEIQDVYIEGRYAYLATEDGLEIIDISDTLNPVKVGQYLTLQNPREVFTEGNYVYLVDTAEGINVFDVSLIAHPKLLGTFNDEELHNNIFVRNGYIFIAEGTYGTKIVATVPLLTVKSPFIGPIAFFIGLAVFSLFLIILRKKRQSNIS